MSDTTTSKTSRSPLIIGVSGHRNLHPASEGSIKRQIGDFLRDLKRHIPETPIHITVGMAQGADLLAAQAALEEGLHVQALLPMPLEEYLKDFDEASSATLLALLRDPRVACEVLTSEPSLPVSTPSGADRDALYKQLTEALIDKCSLLLALWNGETSHLAGGTADTLLRYLGARTLQGRDQRRIDLIDTQGEPVWGPQFVYWIPSPRTDDSPNPSRGPCYLSAVGENLLAVHTLMPQPLELQLGELNAYNHEFERLRAREASLHLDSLLPALGELPETDDRDSLHRIDAEYAKADALAIHYQRLSNRLFQWFSFMASMMALMFLIYAKLFASTVLLSLYLAILAISLGVFYWVRGRDWFSKHLVYRVLAETMRTKFFLHAVGADRLVNAAELINLTGIEKFAGFGWIGNLLRNVEPLNEPQIETEIAKQGRVQRVHHHWIRNQQGYFSSRVRKLERVQHRLERMKGVLLYGIAVFGIILLVFAKLLSATVLSAISFKDVLVFLMGLLPVWLGIWELYQNKMATRELLWQYRNQLSHFTRAELQLSRNPRRESQKEILAEVGKKSLMESYLWTIHRYHREYEPPSAA